MRGHAGPDTSFAQPRKLATHGLREREGGKDFYVNLLQDAGQFLQRGTLVDTCSDLKAVCAARYVNIFDASAPRRTGGQHFGRHCLPFPGKKERTVCSSEKPAGSTFAVMLCPHTSSKAAKETQQIWKQPKSLMVLDTSMTPCSTYDLEHLSFSGLCKRRCWATTT